MFQDFLQIFESSFHKFNLVGVKEIGKFNISKKRSYYKFVGKFEFILPDSTHIREVNSKAFLLMLKNLPEEDSHCFERKFTRRIYLGGKLIRKVSFRFDFDINPKTICGFEFEGDRMILYAVGYGSF